MSRPGIQNLDCCVLTCSAYEKPFERSDNVSDVFSLVSDIFCLVPDIFLDNMNNH